ncbi:MAG: hypothetical protein JXB30_02315 [Anaerolineae bacterium]|nr:hypothetical protein [Anaerolineae bacterium]
MNKHLHVIRQLSSHRQIEKRPGGSRPVRRLLGMGFLVGSLLAGCSTEASIVATGSSVDDTLSGVADLNTSQSQEQQEAQPSSPTASAVSNLTATPVEDLQHTDAHMPAAAMPSPVPVQQTNPTATPVVFVSCDGHQVDEITIDAFTVSPPEARPGENVTLNWQVNGAVSHVDILTYVADPAPYYRPIETTLSAAGSLVVKAPQNQRYSTSWCLHAYTNDGRYTAALASAKLTCPDEWTFPNPPANCPQPPTYTRLAIQRFERGLMIWSEALENIRIFHMDSPDPELRHWEIKVNTWFPGMPESDPSITPPDGYYQPVRGFGQLWRTGEDYNGTIRDRLGWALEPEREIERGVIQCETAVKYQTCYIGDPQGTIYVQRPELTGWYEWTGPTQ